MMRKEPLEILHRLSRAIAKAAKLEEIYQIILEEIASDFGVERASIMRYDPISHSLKIVAARGIEPEIWKTVEIAVGDGVSGQVFSEGKPLLIKQLQKNPRYRSHSFMVAPVTCFPMKVGTVPIGIINLTDKKSGEPFTEEDLKCLTTLSDQVASYMHLCDMAERLKSAEQAKLQLEIAREIQQRLLPKQTPRLKGVAAVGCLIPAERVGADYYDFLVPPGEKSLCLCIADVSGHDVGGALLASAFRSCLRTELQGEKSPAKILGAVNKTLFPDLAQSEQFISSFYATYQSETKQLSFTNAGHNPPLLWRAKKKEPEWLFTQDSLLGIEPDTLYREKKSQLACGDCLVLYTDGLTEAQRVGGDRFGSQRLLSALQNSHTKTAPEMLKTLLETWRHFIGEKPPQDDVTLVVVKIL